MSSFHHSLAVSCLLLSSATPASGGSANPLDEGRCFLLIEETFQRDAVYECSRSRAQEGLRTYGCFLLDRDGCPTYGNFSAMMHPLGDQIVIARQDGTESFDCAYLGTPSATGVAGPFSCARRYTGEVVLESQPWRGEVVPCGSRCRPAAAR